MPDTNLLFIHALTGIHPGGGTALGVVDLPVQRERHTQWPLIPGSSLKGVLRDVSRPRAEDGDTNLWLAAFGPETANAAAYAGALAFTDARILAFPVRSLRGVFAWVTCPAVLARLVRDVNLLSVCSGPLFEPPAVKRGEAVCFPQSDVLVQGDRMMLEEFEFRRSEKEAGVAEWIAPKAVTDQATIERLRRNLVVLHDDDFTYFVRHATEVIARIGLDYETKTARGKALFYEEFLPPETLFYAVVMATDSRHQQEKRGASKMLEFLRSVPPTLQIGADQTIGKGLCSIRFDCGWDGHQGGIE